MKRIQIDEEQMEDDAITWFLSLSPEIRGVYLQALWECETGQGQQGRIEEDDPHAAAESVFICIVRR